MKAQPKQPRVPRQQKHDRLLDVPLTQEWLVSSGETTSRAKPLETGHNRRQQQLLFRDHEQVWAKVRAVLSAFDTATPDPDTLISDSELPVSCSRSRVAPGGPPSSVLTPTASSSVGAGTTSPFSARTERKVTACQTTCATSSSTWAASAQVCQRSALASSRQRSMMRCRSYNAASMHRHLSQPPAASKLRHCRRHILENAPKNRRPHYRPQEDVTSTSMGRSSLALTCWNFYSRRPWKLSVMTRTISTKGSTGISSTS